jgi:hypothetical protein
MVKVAALNASCVAKSEQGLQLNLKKGKKILRTSKLGKQKKNNRYCNRFGMKD